MSRDAARELAANGSPQQRFWRLCAYLGERREAAGDVCWDIKAWRSWIKAARAAGFGFFGYVDRVEAMLNDGKTAEQIRQHFVLAKQADIGAREAEIRAERALAESNARREREKLIEAEADKAFVRAEAARRAKARLGGDESEQPSRRRSFAGSAL